MGCAGPSASSSCPAPAAPGDCLGELVQIDGSEHAWFEDRGPPCTLLAFVDDATSRLMQLRFVASKSAFDYFRTTRAYLEQHGQTGGVLAPPIRRGGHREQTGKLAGGTRWSWIDEHDLVALITSTENVRPRWQTGTLSAKRQ